MGFKMEAIVMDALVEAVIYAVRQDVVDSLMATECCKWSKRRIRKLCKKLHAREDATESIETAKEQVRQSIANLSPPEWDTDSECSDVIEQEQEPKSVILDFIRKITTV